MKRALWIFLLMAASVIPCRAQQLVPMTFFGNNWMPGRISVGAIQYYPRPAIGAVF